jgi:hypothetical protein
VKRLIRFWQEQYGVGQPLEVDSRLRQLLNKHVVAALMNAFPETATRIFSRANGELPRLLFLEKETGSFRVLRAMYRFDEGHRGGDLINRLLMQSPAVKAARNRRRIAQRMLEISLEAMPPHRPILVLAVGGGDGSLEAEVIARAAQKNVYYCGVDRDERAVGENSQVLRRYGLKERGCTIVGSVAARSDLEAVVDEAARRFNTRLDGVSVSVCQGITEYLDLHCRTNESLAAMLDSIHHCSLPQGRLIISQTDYHDRVKYLEEGLSWYMRLRSRDELATEVEKAGWRASVCEREPMGLITMCLASKEGRRSRPDQTESAVRRRHATTPVPPRKPAR